MVSDSLQPHGLPHARLPCSSPTPTACSHSSLTLVIYIYLPCIAHLGPWPCDVFKNCFHYSFRSGCVVYFFAVSLRQQTLLLASLNHKMTELSSQKRPLPVSAAATAKLLQSCPTLCDPRDDSPPGSPVPGILQARTLEWVAISFSNA